MDDRTRDDLQILHENAYARTREVPYKPLGLSVLTCPPEFGPEDEITETDPGEEVTTIHDSRQRRLYQCAARARDRLAGVRPALEQLRDLLGRPTLDVLGIDLAVSDIERALTHARRSVRALSAELGQLESESRELVDLVPRVLR